MFETLYKTDWVSLMRVVTPGSKKDGYIFSHETRCAGHIVAMVPYRILHKSFEFLLRYEMTPCWEPTLTASSFTGGMEPERTPEETAIRELNEESGFVVECNDLISLGTCFGTKSTDTKYHLFSMNLSDKNPKCNLYITDEPNSQKSGVKWVTFPELTESQDPFASVVVLRLLKLLNFDQIVLNHNR